MFHTVAYSASIATGVETDVAAVADVTMQIQNSHIVPQAPCALIYAAAMATNLQRARIQTPLFNTLTTPFIRGIMAGLVPTSPCSLAAYAGLPLDLKQLEEIAILATQNAAGAQRVTAVLGLQMTPPVPANGDAYTIRGTGTAAAVANSWTQIPITWQNALPQGLYATVGLQHQSANGQAARLTFQAQYWRPGCVSQAGLSDIAHPYFFKGFLGEWGRFYNYAMPTVEVLANAADAAHEFYMDVIKVG
jgi:hypothetical protein